MKKILFFVSLIGVISLSSCNSKKDNKDVLSVLENERITQDSLLHYYEAYGLVKSSTEDYSEEKDFNTKTITRRYTEVREYADGTVISRPITQKVPAFLVIYSDGSKDLQPIEDIESSYWVEPGDSVEFAMKVQTKDGKEHTVYL